MVGVIAEEEIVGVDVKLGGVVVSPLRCVGGGVIVKEF